MKHTIRIILTIALLIVVWKHAHWSVALTLTLLSVQSEEMVYCLRRFERRR